MTFVGVDQDHQVVSEPRIFDIESANYRFPEHEELLAQQLHLFRQIAQPVRGSDRLPITAQELTHRGLRRKIEDDPEKPEMIKTVRGGARGPASETLHPSGPRSPT
jgi:hypothetical protein